MSSNKEIKKTSKKVWAKPEIKKMDLRKTSGGPGTGSESFSTAPQS